MVDPRRRIQRGRSTWSERSFRRSACSSSSSGSCRPTPTRRSWPFSWPSGPASWSGFSLTSALGSGPGRNRCCPPDCSRTASPTSACHPERPVAPPHGDVVRCFGLPANRSRLQRHRDGSHLHGGDSWHPAFVLRCGAICQASHAEDLDLGGFVATVAGIGLLLGLVQASDSVLAFAPGLLLVGLGLGIMLTPSVNVVQSSFPEELQGEISGLSRSVSNLGLSFGIAIAGMILVSSLATGNRLYALAMAALMVVGFDRPRCSAVPSCPARAPRRRLVRPRLGPAAFEFLRCSLRLRGRQSTRVRPVGYIASTCRNVLRAFRPRPEGNEQRRIASVGGRWRI